MSFFSSPFNSFYENASGGSSSSTHLPTNQGLRSLHGSPRPGHQSTWKLGASNDGQSSMGSNPWGSSTHLSSQMSGVGLSNVLGMSAPAQPAEPTAKWMYLDLEGNEQGPFESYSMSWWFRAGNFPDTLPVRRVEDPHFVALGDLRHYSQTQDPFMEVIPPRTWARIFATPSEADRSLSHEPFETDHDSDTDLSAKLRGTAISADSRLAAPGTPVHSSRPTPLAGYASLSSVPAPTSVPGAIGTPVSVVEREPLRSETPATVSSPSPIRPDQYNEPSTPAAALKKERRKAKLPEDRELVELKPKQKKQKKKPTRIELSLTDDDELSAPAEQTPEPPIINGLQAFAPPAMATSSTSSVPASPAAPPQQPLAPSQPAVPAWKTTPVTPSAVNLKQLQQQQRELEKQREDERRKTVQAQVQTTASAPAWGAASLGLNSSRRRLSSSGDVVETPKRSGSVVSEAVESDAPVLEEDSDGFKTVSRRGQHGGNRGPAPSTPAAPATASPRAPQPTTLTSAVPAQPANPADELVQWAKVSFKQGVSKDVDHMELLEVFLSLPANSDAKEFIADSIYAYSTTLDGRRFAHELLARRKQAELSFKVGETWKTVLHRANPTMEMDPSFKVVTKKRTRPVPRPSQ